MLAPWLDLPGAQARLSQWSERAGIDLVALGTAAPDDVVRRTEVAQPLLTALALLSGRAVLGGRTPDLVCGHSIGELSALALAGVISDDDAVVLAVGRGRLMAEAAAAVPTGMVALLGGAVAESDYSAAGLELATVNVAGQVVLGGTLEVIESWTPPQGVRARRLDVAGAFHTSAMASAVDGFSELVAGLQPQDAACDVIANADGAVLRDGRQLLDRLVGQLTRPVRFDLCLAAASAASTAVELAPAGVLKGLVKRALPDLPVTAVRTPEDLAAASTAQLVSA
ncbi:MAG: malonyl CoA-acyl carrier protein transacylase [Frankiales bacterium]|jgi:[acyl-carrier-protein] S-malonyltransferase|nr:malonyl CoA-acyl carrier protein transacylase [Frankiales bacterium]